MNNNLEPDEAPGTETEDRYSSPGKLLRIASWSYILSWVILVLEALLFIGRLYIQFLDRSNFAINLAYAFNWIFYLSALAIGIIWFVVLQAISEGIYLWLDIEENSRRGKEG
jgi:hypothetical protein